MKGYKALDSTIHIFHIQAKSLAEKVGISPVQLSRYRNGKSDLYGETLLRILRALPPEAKAYYWLLTMSESSEVESTEILEKIG